MECACNPSGAARSIRLITRHTLIQCRQGCWCLSSLHFLNRFGLSLKLRIASSDVCSDILTANGDRFGLDSAEQDRAHDERSVRWRTEAFARDFGP